MPQLPWTEIAAKPHARHLVVGVVEEGSLLGSVRLIERLLRALPTTGDYGIGSLRENGTSQVRCVFQLGMDAERLVSALHARPVDRPHGWRSERRFVLNSDARKLIALVLTSGKGMDYARRASVHMPRHLASAQIVCGRCRHQFEEPLVWLETNYQFHCPRCDEELEIDYPANHADVGMDGPLKILGKPLLKGRG